MSDTFDMELYRKVIRCLPFADADLGIAETQVAMRQAATEIERLRARVAKLEATLLVVTQEYKNATEAVEKMEVARNMWRTDAMKLETSRDSWKREALAARTCLSHGNRGNPIETYEAWKAARAANRENTNG